MPPDGPSGDFEIDPTRTRIGFSARHAIITTVRGHFGDFAGAASLNSGDPADSTAELTIRAVSIDTGNPSRDGELRTNAFLDVPNHPLITFVSTAVKRTAPRRFELTGDLTIKATTRPVTLRFDLVDMSLDEDGRTDLTFRGTGSLNRRDWQVEWPPPLETGGVLVSDKIGVEITVKARQKTW